MQSESTRILAGETFSYKFSFRQQDLDAFVELSGDCNDIHCDKVAAAESPIGVMAVPGLLTTLVFSRILGTMFPGHGTVYRSQSLDFIHPVVLWKKYVAHLSVQKVDHVRHRAEIETVVAEAETGKECLRGIAVVINFRRL